MPIWGGNSLWESVKRKEKGKGIMNTIKQKFKNDSEDGNRAIAAHGAFRVEHKDQSPTAIERVVSLNSTKRASSRPSKLQIPCSHRCSLECSSIPSLSSRIHSGAVTPSHPRAEPHTRYLDDAKQQSHPLPLPPPFSPATTNSASRSPGMAENLTSPGSRWQKAREPLGSGAYGNVYLGFDRESGEMCAMKEVTITDDAKSRESLKQLGQEIELLRHLHHPNIVKYYGSEMVDDKMYIYMEYVAGGSIFKLLKTYGPLSESVIRNYTKQILLGLAYLHAKNTLHRDIKGANILLDPNGSIKLADFGMAKHISGEPSPLSFKGTPHWMAPEVIRSSCCNLTVDIWSLGCTIIEMATERPPWSEYEGVAALFKAMNSKDLPPFPNHLSEVGKDFLRHCLQKNPQHRPSSAELLLHPFVNNNTPERPIPSASPFDATLVTDATLAVGPAKHSSCLDSEAAGIHFSRSLRTGSGSSDVHTSRNISRQVSPTIRSPRLPPRSPYVSGGLPSPISSPHTPSGSSTPRNGGIGANAIPFHQTMNPISGVRVIQRPQSGRMPSPISSPHTPSGSSTPHSGGIVANATPFHQTKNPTSDGVLVIQSPQSVLDPNLNFAFPEAKHDPIRGVIPQIPHATPDIISNWRHILGDPRGKSVLADFVPQQQFKDHVRLNAAPRREPNC